ncbi:MAG TPA: hypothetical protein VMX36_11625 [Sedimentisphaerales bacterium]|nr:hypothetical protein [Sedimentisphaerales bacterium]
MARQKSGSKPDKPASVTAFIIRAAKIARPNIFVEIDQQVIVQVQPDA